MSNFFHLSPSENAVAIVCSSDARARHSDIFFSPRVPRDHADEKPDPRICIAPSVWQCLIASTDPKLPLFIYSLRCSGARPAGDDERHVEDAEVTQEHWITDDVIAQNGGYIRLTPEGILRETRQARFLLQKCVNDERKVAVVAGSRNEIEHSWLIDNESDPREWRLRLPPSEEQTDDAPLPLPVMWF